MVPPVNESKFQITHLHSGGIIANYYCSSQCRHCLYRCSSGWETKYITIETTKTILDRLEDLQVASFHIGGGEPFLDRSGLKTLLQCIQRSGLSVDYIETNSSWFKDQADAVALLGEIRDLGVSTLLVSISPFHNEFIPFNRVKGVIAACQRAGVNVFPWMEGFYADLDAMADDKPHPMADYKERFGDKYLSQILRRYWIHPGGRALDTFASQLPRKTVNEIVEEKSPCHELLDTSHFHVDLFGNYIPGLCSGLAIDIEDIGDVLLQEKYPLLTLLFNQGVSGLLNLAQVEYSFKAKEFYSGKCHLCSDIRRYLVREHHLKSKELAPGQFYTEE